MSCSFSHNSIFSTIFLSVCIPFLDFSHQLVTDILPFFVFCFVRALLRTNTSQHKNVLFEANENEEKQATKKLFISYLCWIVGCIAMACFTRYQIDNSLVSFRSLLRITWNIYFDFFPFLSRSLYLVMFLFFSRVVCVFIFFSNILLFLLVLAVNYVNVFVVVAFYHYKCKKANKHEASRFGLGAKNKLAIVVFSGFYFSESVRCFFRLLCFLYELKASAANN